MRIGGNANGGIIKVSSDPDGTVTAQRGTLAIDSTTGVTWKNRAGSTMWDPIDIPMEWGPPPYKNDIETVTGLSSGVVGTGSAGIGNIVALGRQGLFFLNASAVGDVAFVSASSVVGRIFGAGKGCFRAAVMVQNLSDGTNNSTTKAGWGDSFGSTADHTDGLFLEYSFTLHANHNWWLVGKNNGARTESDTGIAVVGGAWTNIEVRVNAAGTAAYAVIDGVQGGAVASNIPNTIGRDCNLVVKHIKDLGATLRAVNVDWVSHWQVYSAARGL